MKKNSVICDIDGVIMEMPEWYNLEDFYQNLESCTPIDWMIYLIKGLRKQGLKIIFLTARDSKCRSYTLYQLKQLFDFPIHLYMRNRGDLRPDPEIKKEYMLELMKNNNILFCIDDNIDNCNMYNELGIPALHVKNFN